MKAFHSLIAAVALLSLGLAPALRARADFPPGKQAPPFSLQGFDGSRVSLSDYQGKVVLVHFWEPNCSGCNEEVPTLEKLYLEHAEQGLQVIGVVEARVTPGEIPDFVKRFKTTYPIALDSTLRVARSYRVNGHPTTVLVDRGGVVRHVYNGWVRTNAATLEEAVKTVLKGEKLASR